MPRLTWGHVLLNINNQYIEDRQELIDGTVSFYSCSHLQTQAIEDNLLAVARHRLVYLNSVTSHTSIYSLSFV